MRKIIVLILTLFFITGCDVISNVTITKDLEVQEEVLMTGTSTFFARFYKNVPLTIVKNQLEIGNREALLKNNGYQYQIVEDSKPYPLVKAVKNYSSLEEFTEKTIFKGQYFNNFEVTTNNNLITIKANEFVGLYDEEPERYDIAKFALNIKVPYVVTENNADSYNAKTNTYTWNIDRETLEKEINLTFDKNLPYVYNVVMYISIGVLILLVIIIIVIVIHYIKKSKRNNIVKE